MRKDWKDKFVTHMTPVCQQMYVGRNVSRIGVRDWGQVADVSSRYCDVKTFL